jgi:hypothetical protein
MLKGSFRGRVRRMGAVMAFAALASALAFPSQAAPLVGAVDDATGYPAFYQDGIGTRVMLCDDATRCLPFDGDEGFWWSAESAMTVGGTDALLVLAKEAALGENGGPISFGRLRVRLFGLNPNTTYKITHPYGTLKLRTNAAGDAREQNNIVGPAAGAGDIGCANDADCNWAAALKSPVSQAYLRWDPRIGAKAPAGFLGNVNVEHRVVGSPMGTNYFKVEGPGAGGPGVNSIISRRFALGGQIAEGWRDNVRPAIPAVPNLSALSDTRPSRTDNITSDRKPIIKGMAEDASRAALWVDGKKVASQFADNANYKFSRRLSVGVHRLRVTATDAAGNTSLKSGLLRIRITK